MHIRLTEHFKNWTALVTECLQKSLRGLRGIIRSLQFQTAEPSTRPSDQNHITDFGYYDYWQTQPWHKDRLLDCGKSSYPKSLWNNLSIEETTCLGSEKSTWVTTLIQWIPKTAAQCLQKKETLLVMSLIIKCSHVCAKNIQVVIKHWECLHYQSLF